MEYRLTEHAQEELRRRRIPIEFARRVLDKPEQTVSVRSGRKVLQSRLDFPGGKMYLVRAVVDESVTPAVVITVYRTSKIDKYWSD